MIARIAGIAAKTWLIAERIATIGAIMGVAWTAGKTGSIELKTGLIAAKTGTIGGKTGGIGARIGGIAEPAKSSELGRPHRKLDGDAC